MVTLVGTQQAEPAEKLPSAVVAVVDMQRINKQSMAAQTIRIQVQDQDRVRERERVRAEATRQIQRALYPIFVELSRERGFDIVLNTTQHVFSRKSLNITEDVLTRLNERLPRVQVTIPPVD